MRKLLAVIAGAIAGALVAAVVETLSHQVYPPQAGIDMTKAGALLFAILLAGAVAKLVMQPHPFWVTTAGALVMLPMTALGARLAR